MSSADVTGSRRGFVLVTSATIVAGVGGYAITTILARGLGESYGLFAIFWSALYLVAGALSGIQQEVARATQPRTVTPRRPASVIVLALGAAAAAMVLVLVSSPLWVPTALGSEGWALLPPLTAGAGCFVLMTAAAGTMYGTHSWRVLAAFIVLDVAFRLLLVCILLPLGVGVVGLAWAAVVPYGLVLLVVVLPAWRTLFASSQLDVSYRAVTANVVRTVAAAASTAVIVSGFPLLIGFSSAGDDARMVSAVVFALTLTRAPIVVSTLSLQGYLLVQFRDHRASATRLMLRLFALLLLAAVLLAALAWWLGADAIVWLAGEDFRLPGWYVAALVGTSVATGWIMVAGTAALARGLHGGYSAGWVLTAIVAVVIMMLPIDLLVRSTLALGIAPLVGLAVHILALLRRRRRLELADPEVQ
ncbi:hypothetical protein [Antiquaquibacter soli]|uniref:Polysaccharide biosynthesis protein n=1 Tax=Antiquaquibacter soli TaxID=3064523 RepID=A0ABT9BJD4_9MICO|nr:hypothetical protein [Protaetiibacter sp. WY-16]MDO7881131.1 hypothetical protein [Protaetiibacter sp. WY-16]